MKEVQKVAEVCCPKCAPETYGQAFTILGPLPFWQREVWTNPLHHRWASSCPCRCNALLLLHNLLRIRLHSVFHTLCQSLPHLCGRLLENILHVYVGGEALPVIL